MRKHQPDFVLFFTTLCLVAFGLVMVYSSSMVWAYAVNGASPATYVRKQTISAIVGIVGLLLLSRMPLARMKKLAPGIGIVTFLMLVAVLIPGIGHVQEHVRRWIGPSSLLLQPSEFAIVGIIFYLSYIYNKNVKKLNSFRHGVLPPLVVLLLEFLLIIKEPDMGTAMLLLFTGFAVMFAAGIRKRHFFGTVLAFLPIVAAFAWLEAYRNARLTVFLHPWTDPNAYQLQQSLIAIYHGGLFGRGLGQGMQAFLYLPIPYADFIFAIVVEELGLVGAVVLLGLFSILIWRGIRISHHSSDRFAALMTTGIASMIGFGVLINLGAVTGLLPITGIPLPFISYGGTALIAKLWAMGLMLSLSRYTSANAVGSTRSHSNVRVLSDAQLAQRKQTRKATRPKTSTARNSQRP